MCSPLRYSGRGHVYLYKVTCGFWWWSWTNFDEFRFGFNQGLSDVQLSFDVSLDTHDEMVQFITKADNIF